MDNEVELTYHQLNEKEERRRYHLNPDKSFTLPLIEGLLKNESRYGYWSCPCRLAKGNRTEDLDIICPCDYRDEDLTEFGTCYCGLYVTKEVVLGTQELTSIPERRGTTVSETKMWRCRVCGYLCARPHPPSECPICGVTADRFEEWTLPVIYNPPQRNL